ncbi:MAG TPA: NnrS family protein [Brevundimonas sp.]|uniref:NnrS family protein n=1 Tax=Brevundimonas sp. TaxID=1871086 RepID=UPI0026162EBB|nr:NnrS family protein [Brevundimonas sp.]HRO32105.1 NnrS family protein [Brevundimonas sp.]
MSTAAAMRAYRGPALFCFGFRPFFLFGAVWAAVATPIWLTAYAHGGALAQAGIGLDWHIHEMLFGFVGAIVAGFLLTAVPNWTGRLPVVGAPLAGLFLLWLAGRAAMLAAPMLGLPAWVASIDAVFLVVFAGVIWREVLAGRNWRNLPVAVLASLFALADVGVHLRVEPAGLDLFLRLALAAVAMLLALIGGRVTPSFTRNWLVRRGGPLPAPPAGRFDQAVLIATVVTLGAWVMSPEAGAVGALLAGVGALHLVRLARWRGWRTGAEPLVLILHMGYLWLPVALILMGLSAVGASVPISAGIHALTAGAMGVMILAMTTRASRGHTGRPLAAGWGTSLLYVAVNLAAMARVTAGLVPDLHVPGLIVSTVLWSAAFGGFALIYGPMLLKPRPDLRPA